MRRTWRPLILFFVFSGTALLLSAPLSPQTSKAEDFPGFSDVAEKLGITLMNVHGGPDKDYIIEANGNGAAFFDYDGDGDMDLWIANGSTLGEFNTGGSAMAALYENSNGRFMDVTQRAGLTRNGWGMGVCVADFDNDGLQDVYGTGFGPNVLYRNNGDGAFVDVTSSAGVSGTSWSTNCAFGDYDKDGDVDLYVANYIAFDEATIPARGESEKCKLTGIPVLCGPHGLPGAKDVLYRNNGDGTFTDVTVKAGIKDPGLYGFGVRFSDLDNDGWPDIYVANDGNPNFLFHNNRDGTFSEEGLLSGASLNEAGGVQSGMGVSIADIDNDGFFDIFVTNYANDSNTLYSNVKNLLFVDNTAQAGLGEPSWPHVGWGTGFQDFDNDGLRDIFVANGHVYPQVDALDMVQRYAQRKELYRNLGKSRFQEIAAQLPGDLLTPKSARGTAFGDFDNDGDIDALAVNMDDTPDLYLNSGTNRNEWITFRLEGTRSNRDAIGARIEIDAGGRTQVAEVQSGGSYLSHSDMRIHFGLGNATRVDRVRIRWPNSPIEELSGLKSRHFVTVREGDGVIASVPPVSRP